MPTTQTATPPRRPAIWAWGLCLLAAAALLPFVLLSFYNHPFMDDYYNAANVQRLGLWGAQRDLYLNWSGRWFSSALVLGLNPMRYGWYDALRWAPLLVLSLSVGVAYVGVRTLTRWRRPLAGAAALATVVVYLQLIPEPYSAVYWLTGAIVYQLAGLWVILAVAAGVRTIRAETRSGRRWWGAAAAFGTLGAAASNEMSLLHLLLALVVLAGLFWRDARARRVWLRLLALAAVAGVLMLIAPGNTARLGAEFSDNPVRRDLYQGVMEAVSQAYFHSRSFLAGFPLLLWLVVTLAWLLLVLHYRSQARPAPSRYLPWYAGLLFMAVALFATMFLFRVSTGRMPPPRAINGLWLFLLPAWLTVVWSATACWHALRWPRWLPAAALGAGLMALIGTGTTRRAWQEWRYGAPSYDQQLLARESRLRSARAEGITRLVVPPILGVTPQHVLISGWDLAADPTYYVNTETALYFGLDSVRVDARLLPRAHEAFRQPQ